MHTTELTERPRLTEGKCRIFNSYLIPSFPHRSQSLLLRATLEAKGNIHSSISVCTSHSTDACQVLKKVTAPLLQAHLKVIGRLFDDLWCHPEGCPNKCVPLDLGVCQLPSHPKVSQFHIPLL